MPLSQNNLYHPFRDPLLGFSINNMASSLGENGSILYDIDLYYQPVQDPAVSSVFTSIMALILLIGVYLHTKLFVRLGKETGLVQNVTMVFVIAQMIHWPVTVSMITLTNFVHPLNDVIGQWICTTAWFVSYYLCNVISSHSFMAALMRYFYIVHHEKVKSWGKENFKRLFLFLVMFIPLLITICKANDGAELDSMSYFNKCYGKHHEVFLVETSTPNIFKKNFCEMEIYNEDDVYGHFIALVKQFLCAASLTTMLIVGSNLSEAFIYYRLFSYINR
jgi:hypothetical protein